MRVRTGKAIQLLRKPNCCANARVPPVAEVPAGSAVLPGSCRCGLLRKSTYRDTDGDCFASRDIGSTASQERESASTLSSAKPRQLSKKQSPMVMFLKPPFDSVPHLIRPVGCPALASTRLKVHLALSRVRSRR
jgi:hypothetical protein